MEGAINSDLMGRGAAKTILKSPIKVFKGWKSKILSAKIYIYRKKENSFTNIIYTLKILHIDIRGGNNHGRVHVSDNG